MQNQEIEQTKFKYSYHPRLPNRSAGEIFDHIYDVFRKKANARSKPNDYMLFDYLHDFRIWANYLDIDNLLNLWGTGYKSFIDQNLSTLLFFIGGFSEIGYISVFGEDKYLEQLQNVYDLLISNNPELENDFINTSIFQRSIIYSELGFIKTTILLKQSEELNKVITRANI